MSGFTIDTSQLNRLGKYLNAFDSEIRESAPRAANKTATWLRTLFVNEVAKLGPKKALVRSMTKIVRAKQNKPYAFVRPSGQRLYANSFTQVSIEQVGSNATRGRINVTGFQKTKTAIGFVNQKAEGSSANGLRTRTKSKQLTTAKPALSYSPAMLFHDFVETHSDLEDQIYLKLTAHFEDTLSEAMNQR
ncbi:hypothetical protein BGP77_11440 [Saccharospirillum sp. MSK14-1]|uniref:hypothetical protein n=1 Tax=Saccharospirillum sp. MSK14-1 TaxID=1897632 RepID=UPI000D38B6C4|nr:hypothetical protein [Saccharospirillum sp. MSK14-1]PTY38554.1 hypothetical protein BGP77_11440 [Saccharospirillum sp. MSK14-1]